MYLTENKWSLRQSYKPPSITKIKKKFKENIDIVPPNTSLESIVEIFNQTGSTHTLDLKHCNFLPPHTGEAVYHTITKHLDSDTELINFANENDWNQDGKLWKIRPINFNQIHSNYLKDVYQFSLNNRKAFLNQVNTSHKDEDVPFEARFRYDAIQQDWAPWTDHETVHNVWDYVTAIKGGALFYTERAKGNYIDIDSTNYIWTTDVPRNKNPNKTYKTTIEYIPEKERTIRNYIGSCTCPDYKKKSSKNRNRICKHQMYLLAEVTCHVENISEIFPFPTLNAFALNEKLDNLLYPDGKKTDTQKDSILRAHIDCNITDISKLFKTEPNYVKKIHIPYKNIKT